MQTLRFQRPKQPLGERNPLRIRDRVEKWEKHPIAIRHKKTRLPESKPGIPERINHAHMLVSRMVAMGTISGFQALALQPRIEQVIRLQAKQAGMRFARKRTIRQRPVFRTTLGGNYRRT